MNIDTNWVTDSPEKIQANNTRKILAKVKKDRYSSGRQYKVVKVSDFPPTYKEVFIGYDPAVAGSDLTVKMTVKRVQ